jgi:hypothetical protein
MNGNLFQWRKKAKEDDLKGGRETEEESEE